MATDDDYYFLLMEEEGARGLVERRRERNEEINFGIAKDERRWREPIEEK